MLTGQPNTWVEVPMSIENVKHTFRGTIVETQSLTPADVAEYLVCMGWGCHYSGTREYWRRNDNAPHGYFTWEQAVAYTMVRPFLTRDTK